MLEDKIKIKALLETYSIKEISSIFSNIDNKLLSVHKCSSDDFLNLNEDFKNLYKQSKVISDNVKTILTIFDNQENISLYNQIHDFYYELKDQIDVFDNKVNITIKFLEELSNQLRFIFFPIKNYTQNLMSLKYLMANFNLTQSYKDQENKIIEITTSIEKIINDLRQLSERITKNLNHLRKVTKVTFSNFKQVKNQNEINIEELLTIVKSRIEEIDGNFNENKGCIPIIRKKTEKSADSISDIIKKLQYQDIIKQKMEHIQKTHRDIIDELGDFEKLENNEKLINEKAKFFLRIRDIAGLQAAQLIQANKEYQSAIEIIINNFMQIGDNMKGISEMCGKINEGEINNEVELFNDIVAQITKTEEGFVTKFDQNKKLYKDISLIDNQLNQVNSYTKIFDVLNNNLSTKITEYFNMVQKSSVKNYSNFDQLDELRADVNTNGLKLRELIEKLFPIKSRIQSFITEHKKLDLSSDFSNIKNVASKLYDIREKISSILLENSTISKQALDNIKKSISDIKYYDYFESIIEEIILDLNTINYNLKVDEDSAKSKDQNLEQLKEYYTMETEHIIHDKITKGEELDDFIESDEDGNIEFF